MSEQVRARTLYTTCYHSLMKTMLTGLYILIVKYTIIIHNSNKYIVIN